MPRALPCAVLVAGMAAALPASARTRQRHFEPEDLELEVPGTLDVDVQMGPVYGDSADNNRLILPDFELSLGLMPNVELDVDGAFSFSSFDHGLKEYTGEPLWIAAKLGLFDSDDGSGHAWAFGVELGPRLPTIDAGGIGYGALGLVGLAYGRLHVVGNLGALIDPGPTLAADHPKSIVGGLDLDLDLDAVGRWSLQGQISASRSLSHDPHELSLASGLTYAVSPKLDLSILGLVGFLPNTDHGGVLFGASPKIRLW